MEKGYQAKLISRNGLYYWQTRTNLAGLGISDRTIRSNFPEGAVRLSGAWLLDLYSGMVVYRPN